MKIFTPTPGDPFVVKPEYIITPICSRGYTGALIIRIILEQMLGPGNVRKHYGITADPEFVFANDMEGIIVATDVTEYDVNDEFEQAMGFKRNATLHNIQTVILKQMRTDTIMGPNKTYAKLIKYNVWKFPTNKQKVFILMTMDQKEIDATVKNLSETDILVIFRCYNEVAYPINGSKPFSKEAYTAFINKVKQYFVLADSPKKLKK